MSEFAALVGRPVGDVAREREALATLVRVLDLDEEEYERTVELTRDLLADEYFKELRDALARALSAVPRLEAEDVEALAAAAGFPVANEGKEMAWS